MRRLQFVCIVCIMWGASEMTVKASAIPKQILSFPPLKNVTPGIKSEGNTNNSTYPDKNQVFNTPPPLIPLRTNSTTGFPDNKTPPLAVTQEVTSESSLSGNLYPNVTNQEMKTPPPLVPLNVSTTANLSETSPAEPGNWTPSQPLYLYTSPQYEVTTDEENFNRSESSTISQAENVTTPLQAVASTRPPSTCNNPLGLSNGIITDDNITASSEAFARNKEKVRLDCCTDEAEASWCPDESDPYPWIEFRLPQAKYVSAIIFQHPSRGTVPHLPEKYVKTVTLKYVPAGASDTQHFVIFQTGIRVLNATSAFKVKLNIYTQRIRIHPDMWHGQACFRAELYGCDSPEYGSFLTTVINCSDVNDLLQCVPEHHNLEVISGSAVNFISQCHEPLLYIRENSCVQLPLTLTCFKDPDSCPDGFTISLNVKVETESPRYLLSTGRERHNHTGVTLFYQNDMLTGTVQLQSSTWMVSTLHMLTTGTWHWLEITWTKNGLQLYAEGKLIASSPSPSLTETSLIHSNNMKIGCSDDMVNSYGGIWIKKLVMSPISRERLVDSSPYIHNAKGLPDSICGEMTPPSHNLETTPSTAGTTTHRPFYTLLPVPECNKPLWNTKFFVYDVTTSSDGYNTSAAKSMADCCAGPEKGGWCPDPLLLSSSSPQFIEVNFQQPIAIQSIEIQPPELNSPTSRVTKYLTSYNVQYQPLNGANLISLATVNGPVEFRGVDVTGFSIVSTVTTIPSIVTKRIRIVVKNYHKEPCFRFQLFGCEREVLCPSGCENGGKCITKDTCSCPVPFFGLRCENSHLLPGKCRKPLGMSDGTIKDDQLKVSSEDLGKTKEKARYGCCVGEHNGAWCPAPSDSAPYYEVKFPKEMLITEIMFDFPSRNHDFDNHDTFMKTFSVYYLYHDHLNLYASGIQAIYNSTVTFTDDFDPYLRTNLLRIVPETWEKAPCFRFELIGCVADDTQIVVGRRKRREVIHDTN